MAFRTPRGYDVNRPSYQELSQGIRPEASTVPMEAWTGLAPVRVDEIHHDPIVLDAGTCVGIATGGAAEGKLFPAHTQSGATAMTLVHHSDGATWGLPAANHVESAAYFTAGPVLPLGVVYQPIYSFMLQSQFTNYKRNENVGVVTDYLIQVPATTAEERAIMAGEMVMVSKTAVQQGAVAAGTARIGRYQRYQGDPAGAGVAATVGLLKSALFDSQFVVGRCFSALTFATGTASVNTVLSADYSNVSLTTAGAAEFKGLSKVQTVPGLGLGGSGTAGTPAWLRDAQSDSSGNYKALTILIRL
jgi:hypothetical protein